MKATPNNAYTDSPKCGFGGSARNCFGHTLAMETSTHTHHGQTPEIIWAEVFATMYLSLSGGEGDMHHLIDWGYELWPTHGAQDASEVAREEFAKANP